MKKNVILLVIDSFDYKRLTTAKERGIDELFLHKLEKKSVTASNMYSQAPYTEAASMSLYCGQRTLDKGGYLEKFNTCPKNLFEAFEDAGYDVFFNGYQPHIYPSTLAKGINHCYYNCGYDFENGFWYYRLKHYTDVYKNNDLTEEDIEFLIRAFDDNFQEWKLFLERWINKDISLEMIRDLSSGFEAEKALDMLLKQINIYNQDKKKFLMEVFNLEKKHPLFDIPTMKMDEKIKDREFLEETSRRYKKIINKIQRKNFTRNLFNNFFTIESFKEIWRVFVDCTKKRDYNYFLRYGFSWYTLLFDPDLKGRIKPDYDFFKISPDIDKHFDQFISWKERNKKSDKPYFACLHVEGMHNPEVIFSHDSVDRELLDSQFKTIENYVDNLPKNYKGSITYDLSMIHYSERIEEIYNNLCDKGIINDDTYFVITADHGFSFTGDPVRERFVTNFYLENYRIPFIIYNSNLEPYDKRELTSGDDLPPTLLNLCDIKAPDNFSGKSILDKENNRDYILIEYMGSGCPDLKRRDFHYAIYDEKYFISAYVTLKEELSEGHIKDIFDIEKDEKQMNNLKGKIAIEGRIEELFTKLIERHNEIRKENKVN